MTQPAFTVGMGMNDLKNVIEQIEQIAKNWETAYCSL